MKVLINEDSNEGSDTCDKESIADRNAAGLADANKDNIGTKKIRRKKTDRAIHFKNWESSTEKYSTQSMHIIIAYMYLLLFSKIRFPM